MIKLSCMTMPVGVGMIGAGLECPEELGRADDH